MNTIWKYPLEVIDCQEVEMPQGARILAVQSQKNMNVFRGVLEPEAVGGKDGKPIIYVPKPGVSMRTLEMDIAVEAAKGGIKP